MALALVPDREVSLPAVVDATTLAAALGLADGRTVRMRATAERWRSTTERCSTGHRRIFFVESLPADVFAALLRHVSRSAPAPEPTPAPPVELALVRDVDRETAVRRSLALDAWHAWSKAYRAKYSSVRQAQDAWCAEYSAEHPETALSRATLVRWRAAYQAHGIEGLVPGYRERGRAAEWPAAARLYLRTCWLRPTRPGMSLAIRELRAKAQKESWALPSDQTMRRFLQSIPRYQVAKGREGEAAARACLPYLERRYDDLNVNDVWVADHEVFDCWVLWPNGEIARPWATAFQDMASRRIVGRCVTAMPCSETIIVAFTRGCRAHGVPVHGYFDNGPDFSSRELAGNIPRFRVTKTEDEMLGLYRLLGVEGHFAIPGNPGAKPVERFFGTQRQTFEKGLLRGYTGRNPLERPDSTEAARKRGDVLTLGEFEVLFDRWVEEVYHQAPHRGHGMNRRSPNQVWNAKLPEAQIRVAAPPTLALLMTRSKTVKVGPNGVTVEKRHFWSEQLAAAVRKADLGKQVVVRYDREDLSEVQVFDLAGRWIAPAQVVERVGFLDDQAPEAIGRKKKFVRGLHAGDLDAQKEVARGLDQGEMILTHIGPVVAAERPQVLTPLRTVVDQAARELAKAGEVKRVEKVRKAEALAAAEAKLAALSEREAVTPAAAAAEAWRSLRRVMGVE
jgi:transposase InsO family protein